MGAGASTIPNEIDQETFKTLCGEEFDEIVFDVLKDGHGYISKVLFDALAQNKEGFKNLQAGFNSKANPETHLLSITEVKELVVELGYALTEEDEPKIKDVETMNFSDFFKLMVSKITSSNVIASFQVFDRDGDGYITAVELKRTMEEMGEVMTDQEAEEMVKEADINGDGVIDLDEYSKRMA